MISPVTNEEKQKLLESVSLREKVVNLENIINFYLLGQATSNERIIH